MEMQKQSQDQTTSDAPVNQEQGCATPNVTSADGAPSQEAPAGFSQPTNRNNWGWGAPHWARHEGGFGGHWRSHGDSDATGESPAGRHGHHHGFGHHGFGHHGFNHHGFGHHGVGPELGHANQGFQQGNQQGASVNSAPEQLRPVQVIPAEKPEAQPERNEGLEQIPGEGNAAHWCGARRRHGFARKATLLIGASFVAHSVVARFVESYLLSALLVMAIFFFGFPHLMKGKEVRRRMKMARIAANAAANAASNAMNAPAEDGSKLENFDESVDRQGKRRRAKHMHSQVDAEVSQETGIPFEGRHRHRHRRHRSPSSEASDSE